MKPHLKVSCFVLTVLAIICIEMSLVSWFVQLKRIFAICLFISLMWYWIYLYKPNAVTTKIHCDAEVNLSKQMLAEIQKLVNKDSSWRNASLEDALSKILIDFKHHDHESSRNWRFEDTFGVEPDMVIKVMGIFLIIVAIICTEMWSVVSWFVQFKRLFVIYFFISLLWKWYYLYMIAYAEQQAKLAMMENLKDKCTGVKKLDWMDNIKEWIRTTWTLQEDPCKQYYETLIVNRILGMPLNKVVELTMITLITDHLEHLSQGIDAFLRGLLDPLSVRLHNPVLLAFTHHRGLYIQRWPSSCTPCCSWTSLRRSLRSSTQHYTAACCSSNTGIKGTQRRSNGTVSRRQWQPTMPHNPDKRATK
ncbi:chloride channel CLIC-like protein 1 isoform X2 [Silurus meridionalis]|uniref:chloride channel CLIC-like protein 1 isoform X2 n=1 Tax=Silurus meridionalis TaxID=175797 RepID=UPI001EEACBF4|nr:chloride channel CLIC-like protein 1 isoform X2 [Silurus meridionalis]